MGGHAKGAGLLRDSISKEVRLVREDAPDFHVLERLTDFMAGTYQFTSGIHKVPAQA